MARIIPFKNDHLDVMEIRDHERQILSDESHRAMLSSCPISCTGIEGGRIICCGGVIPFLSGNAVIWLVPSVYITQYQKTFQKELQKWLFQVREDLALQRMETECVADELHDRWMTYLGFTKEGTKKKYFNGVDYNVWGRIWE